MFNNRARTLDPEVYMALWMAICDAADKLAGRCKVYLSQTDDPEASISLKMQAPDVATWKLVEALSLLSILLKADKIDCGDVTNLFGKIGPLHFVEDGNDRFLWAQPTLTGQESELSGRPDLVISANPETPTPQTTVRVVECKCRKHLGAHEIRAEFGKAYDLKVTSYLIWSLTSPSPRAVAGARRLGLDLVALGFDTPQRPDLISKPEHLVAHVANTLEVSKREARFAHALLESGQQTALKIQ